MTSPASLAGDSGGATASVEEDAVLDSREDALPFCDSESYWIDFYSDASLTRWVGFKSCGCNETAHISGRQTAFAVTDFYSICR
ncbi:hypothetical protein [Myxococcus sp. SDU36]|uniref:hypothetical protein n=1 Tax=Myxococcus sp. SDU36 TaxID=2831967 RepID=UPI0025433BC4|nr:hypothetical protein [Myxococcus sp. SDU36]WIG98448.1 hypothetical protein KGD87_14270 [Myxococcus sp. SDU36]